MIAARIGAVAFLVHDHAVLRARGVTFLEEPRHESDGIVAAFCDLYGNHWDLIEPAPVV